MKSPLHVLIVEDSLDDTNLMIEQLRDGGFEPAFKRVETGAEFESALSEQAWDVLLVDWKLPEMNGWEALRRYKQSRHDIPFIIVSGQIGEETAVEAMKSGAHDFILKDSPARLIPAIERELREAADRQARRNADAEIIRLNAELERRVVERTAMLEFTVKELEAFSYSISHDLRAPLRSIRGFSKLLLKKHRHQLDEQGVDYLQRIEAASGRMSQLIEDLLKLSHVSRGDFNFAPVDLSASARAIATELQATNPERCVEWVIAEGVTAHGDARLLRLVLENLLHNAWKFTSRHARARIEFGARSSSEQPVYFVRDDGAGFDPARLDQLFLPFSRLHSERAFEGSGIGLALVKRIIQRHGGRIWAEGAIEKGAAFYFELPPPTGAVA